MLAALTFADCARHLWLLPPTGDWSGIGGDPVKFGLGVVSMVFDVIMLRQHYVWFRGAAGSPSRRRASKEEVQGMLESP